LLRKKQKEIKREKTRRKKSKMNKWFNEKLERGNIRKHILRPIKKNRFLSFSRKLSITNWIILINFAIFIIVRLLMLSFGEDYIMDLVALKANSFFSGSYWTVFTSMFVHVLPVHLIFNMISLFFVGNFLERIVGRKKYLRFYIISGLFAGLFYVILSFYFGNTDIGAKIFVDPNIPAVGASGAIFGVAGLLAVLTPYMQIYFIIGPLIAIIIQLMLDKIIQNAAIVSFLNLIITIYIFFSIFAMFSFSDRVRKIAIPVAMPLWFLPFVAIPPLVIIGLIFPLPIGNTAHLGGLIAGLFYGYYLRQKYKKKTRILREHFREF